MRSALSKVWRKTRRPLGALLVVWLAWRALRLYAGAPELQTDWTLGTRVLARDGRVLGERSGEGALRGRHVPLDEVSPRLIEATLASEDRAFWRHDGVDRAALARALYTNLVHGRTVSGGSTITAQLVKRLDHRGGAHQRTLPIKLWELARAQNLESQADKRRLLEAYLDVLDYGHGLAGPEAAAQGYFGVRARDLSLAQAALLAVLPRAPSALNPYRHRARAVARQRALLTAMHAAGRISSEDLQRALQEPLVLTSTPRAPRMRAPHLVLAASREASGTVQTTLDWELQRDVEAMVGAHVASLADQRVGSGCAVVVDNQSGEILAEVGSASYFDRKNAGAVDLLRRKRQAGSTLKPFLYARAFERGVSPMAPLADVPTELGTTGAVYAPDNFDGTFAGPVPAREALAASLNVPAVRLARQIGVDEVLTTLRHSGFSLAGDAQRYGLSIALGSGEVSPLEMVSAYAMLARGGEWIRVTDRPAPIVTRAVLAADATMLVSDALADPIARVHGLNVRAALEFTTPVALKTGTSTGHRDVWTAGYSHEHTVVVWLGNADGSPTRGLTGASGAAQLFVEIMKRAQRGIARAPLFAADQLEEHEVCALSGARPTHACTDVVTRKFARGHSPREECTLHRHAQRRGNGWTCNESPNASTIVALPDEYTRYLAERTIGAPGRDPRGIPWLLASQLPGCRAEDAKSEAPRIEVIEPRHGSLHPLEAPEENPGDKRHDRLRVVVETHGLGRGVPLEIVVDGRVLGHMTDAAEATVPLAPGDHDLQVRPRDPSLAVRVGHAKFAAR